MVRRALLLVLALLMAAPAWAQEDRWTAHTSMRGVEALAASGDALWVATSGGVFSYTPATGAFQRYTAAEGLHNVQTRAIAYDARREVVWIGYRDGALDRLDPATGAVDTFLDVARNDRFPAREINRLLVRGDSVLAATAFGLVVFDPVRGEVRDTYSQLGALTPATAVRDVAVAPLPGGRAAFWLATAEGLAYAPLSAANLQDPGAWTVDRDALPDPSAFSVAPFEGAVYVGTAEGLARRNPDGTYDPFGFTDRPVRGLAPMEDRLLAIDDFKLYAAFSFGGSLTLAEGFADLTAVTVGPDGNVWIGGRQAGLNGFVRPTGNEQPAPVLSEGFPEGPFDGLFEDLASDDAGTLWGAATRNTPGGGFYRLAPDGAWTNYTGRFVDALGGRSAFTGVHPGADGSLWAASFGDGLAQVTPEGEVVVYDRANSTLQAAAGTSDFVIVGGAYTEDDGTLWVTNVTAARPLHVRAPDGTWTALQAPRCQGLVPTTALGEIFIDAFGQKWIVVLDATNFRLTRGLIVLDTGADPTDASDDTCRFLDQTPSGPQGFPSLALNAVVGDREGQVWVATDKGPAFILSSSVAAQDPATVPNRPVWADRALGTFVLNGLVVNDIAVDPANNLWMATNEGAFLIGQEGGFQRLEHFTAENSPLFSDVVVAVAVDGRTGEVYFATDQGLISFRGDAVAAAPERRALLVYPNPVRLSDGAAPEIFVEGLVEETDVRVVTPSGTLVAQFDARGGRARWDGRDLQGALVPSGVYLVVAVGRNGEGTAYGKVAVIR